MQMKESSYESNLTLVCEVLEEMCCTCVVFVAQLGEQLLVCLGDGLIVLFLKLLHLAVQRLQLRRVVIDRVHRLDAVSFRGKRLADELKNRVSDGAIISAENALLRVGDIRIVAGVRLDQDALVLRLVMRNGLL